jgi:iron complex outermembrane receptor protein
MTMTTPRRNRFGILCPALAFLLAFAGPARSQPPPVPKAPVDAPGLEGLDLEQLMDIEVVFAASKRDQRTRDVLSFVSVVTAEEIRAHGYRTLGDILRTLPGFYVSNDRSASHVGVRGFERPGDPTTRVLVLMNGLRTNNNIYDAAGVGEEFLVDADTIERVEVIRGPSAAIYGSNAFFAVINVVTMTGRTLKGIELAASGASFGTYGGRATYGAAAGDADVLLSASFSESSGRQLYFPEFDDPATRNGVSTGADAESFHRLLAVAHKGRFALQAAHGARDKHDPTGSYATVFADPRTHTADSLTLASVDYTRPFASRSQVSARLDAGRFHSAGDYPLDAGRLPIRSGGEGRWWGATLDGSRAMARHFVTAGAEYRDNYRQDLKAYDREPPLVFIDLQKSSTRFGMFAQDEIKLGAPLTLYLGVRYDHYETFGSATSPRIGLVYSPSDATTFKVLAGRAFRAPNVYELYFDAGPIKANPQLQPDRIDTVELVAQRFVARGLQVTASAFRNRLSDLVVQEFDPIDSRIAYHNAETILSRGAELGLEMNRGHGPTGQVTYSLQRTEDVATGIELTNSPRHMATLRVLAPAGRLFSAGLDSQFVSERRTLAGRTAPAFAIVNASLLSARVFRLADVSVTVYNVFGASYGVVASAGYRQDVIVQDGRSLRVKTTLRF